jgi:hypothetical protein
MFGDEQAKRGPVPDCNFGHWTISSGARIGAKTGGGFAVRLAEGAAERRNGSIAGTACDCGERPIGFGKGNGGAMQSQPCDGRCDGLANYHVVESMEVKGRKASYFGKMSKVQIRMEVLVDVSHDAINPFAIGV